MQPKGVKPKIRKWCKLASGGKAKSKTRTDCVLVTFINLKLKLIEYVREYQQNVRQNHKLKNDWTFENTTNFKQFWTILTNYSGMLESSKNRLNWSIYQSFQNRFSSCLLSKNFTIKIYRNINVPVWFWCATRFVTLGVAHPEGIREQGAEGYTGPTRMEQIA